ncbi:MAG TPA: UDP-N-acetylmuramate dehydrogenase [Elusimicrobiota bacterium]|nr:UDP-N-acetylmuramate dehydrogenase [Elusimicrobiota bacterium]
MAARTGWREKWRARFPQAKFDEPLSRHTTFHIGGPGDCYLEVGNPDDLRDSAALAAEQELPVFFLGQGSNLLVLDRGIRGVVVRLKGAFDAIETLDHGRVRAGAGARVPKLASFCAQKGLAGLEPLIGVPGTVGGALVMNAGTPDGEIGPWVAEVEIWNAEKRCRRVLPRGELRFGYRSSNLGGRIILGCVLQLNAGDKVDIMKRVRSYQRRRLQTQPIHTYNVGSVFKNPPGRFVARLVEEAGLKGRAVGGARVSPKHANFIENFSGATARDVLELIELIRQKVRETFAVELELEVKVVGEA